MGRTRAWVGDAIRKIEADFNRSADTHLLRLDIPTASGITLYFKDESIHPTGSLKHRLARSLFLYALCNGWIRDDTVVVEASSGSTAVSEAYFAQLLGLPFIAVMPRSTSPEKIALIEFYGGRCHLVETPAQMYAESYRLAQETGGHFMDQFTYAERATDWRGNNNIAESIFSQLAAEEYPIPEWVVCGAGTGGTSATLGRYVRYRRTETRICVVDPEQSVYFDFYQTRDRSVVCQTGSRIEGIGRPRVEASFVPDVVDRMIKVPDAASFAAIRFLHRVIGRKCGGSTGTNFFGALQLIAEMKVQDRKGSVVTLICDPGERYLHTYYNDEWLKAGGYNIQPYYEQIERFFTTGEWREKG
ncbi:MAG: PLP-dependent cysteine synthase family protein [Candidatus Binatia bacterium]